MNRTCLLLLAALLVLSCATTPKPDPNIARPLSNLSLPPTPVLDTRPFLRVSDGYLWLNEDDLNDGSRARALMRQYSAENQSGDWNFAEHIGEVLGHQRSFTFVSRDRRRAQKVRIAKSEFYLYDRTRPDFYERHAKRFGSCNGYPASAWILEVTDNQGRLVSDGFLFAQDVVLHTAPRRSFAKQYAVYRKTHGDKLAFAVSLPNGDLYLFGPSPPMGEDLERAYLFRKNSLTPEVLTLKGGQMCAA